MSTNLNIGDKVVALSNTGNLVKGSTYHIRKIFHSGMVGLKEYPFAGFNPRLFERLPDKARPHKDAIIAWAYGADIEFSLDGIHWEKSHTPQWRRDVNYRIASPIRDVVRQAVDTLKEASLSPNELNYIKSNLET